MARGGVLILIHVVGERLAGMLDAPASMSAGTVNFTDRLISRIARARDTVQAALLPSIVSGGGRTNRNEATAGDALSVTVIPPGCSATWNDALSLSLGVPQCIHRISGNCRTHTFASKASFSVRVSVPVFFSFKRVKTPDCSNGIRMAFIHRLDHSCGLIGGFIRELSDIFHAGRVAGGADW